MSETPSILVSIYIGFHKQAGRKFKLTDIRTVGVHIFVYSRCVFCDFYGETANYSKCKKTETKIGVVCVFHSFLYACLKDC